MQTDQLSALRREFAERGYYRRPTLRIIVELLANLALGLSGLAIFINSNNMIVSVCAMIVSTAGFMGVGTNTHTSSHYATSPKKWVNEFLTYFGFPLVSGVSATHWWRTHVQVHHSAPNVIGLDQDVDLWPWFVLTSDQIGQVGKLRRFYYEKLQWLVLPVAVAGNLFNMQRAGWAHVLRLLFNSRERKASHWIDFCMLVLNLLLVLVLPMLVFAPSAVIAIYLVRNVCLGYAMFAVLGPAHFPREATCIRKQHNSSHFLWRQTSSTLNFRTGFVGRLICSGLQYQIEHHLFPGISHVYYPAISKTVRQFCVRNSLPYRSAPWDQMVWKAFAAFRKPRLSQEVAES